MPKLIDYPRTSYAGAWELSEVVDDTGGKCAIEMAARKLDRKVSGSFKAIIGSAVKFGLMASKREVLSTTTLFRRIKHAYDKQEELLFHREAFLTPPLFTQLCRKFRGRELPVQMLDVMLIREFGVEEINAQGVAKAFVEGARMVNLLDEQNVMADIDMLAGQQGPRRELASPPPPLNTFRAVPPSQTAQPQGVDLLLMPPRTGSAANTPVPMAGASSSQPANHSPSPAAAGKESDDAIANLFGLAGATASSETNNKRTPQAEPSNSPAPAPTYDAPATLPASSSVRTQAQVASKPSSAPRSVYQVQISGPGVDSVLSIVDEDDIMLAQAMLEKIRRQLKGQ